MDFVPPSPDTLVDEPQVGANRFTAPIDVNKPQIQNDDGSVSTERTITIEADGKHFVIPTIVGGRQLSQPDAIEAWRLGQNKPVGIFDNPDEANQYARQRTDAIGKALSKNRFTPPPADSLVDESQPDMTLGEWSARQPRILSPDIEQRPEAAMSYRIGQLREQQQAAAEASKRETRKGNLLAIPEYGARAVDFFGATGRALNAVGEEGGKLAEDITQGDVVPGAQNRFLPRFMGGATIARSTPPSPIEKGIIGIGKTAPTMLAQAGITAVTGMPAPAVFGGLIGSQTLAEGGTIPQAVGHGIVGAAIPMAGGLGKEAAATVLNKAVDAGLLSAKRAVVQKAVESVGSQGAMQVFMGGLDLPQYVAATPEDRRKMLVENIIANSAWFLMDVPGLLPGRPSETQRTMSPITAAADAMRQAANNPHTLDALQKEADKFAEESTLPDRTGGRFGEQVGTPTETRNVPGEVPRVMPWAGTWRENKPTIESETPNAIDTQQQQVRAEEKLPRVPPRQDLPQNPPEIRQSEGASPNGSGGTVAGPTEETAADVSRKPVTSGTIEGAINGFLADNGLPLNTFDNDQRVEIHNMFRALSGLPDSVGVIKGLFGHPDFLAAIQARGFLPINWQPKEAAQRDGFGSGLRAETEAEREERQNKLFSQVPPEAIRKFISEEKQREQPAIPVEAMKQFLRDRIDAKAPIQSEHWTQFISNDEELSHYAEQAGYKASPDGHWYFPTGIRLPSQAVPGQQSDDDKKRKDDLARYTELTQQIKTATPEQRPAIWQEIETIKNRNGGMVPKGVEAPEPQPATTAFDPSKISTVEVPIEKIKLSQDVPNFKGEASVTTGVVPGQELEGKYERKGTAPVVLWRRNNGDLEIITGRHRLDLARRNKEKTIPSQIVDEAAGFTRAMALTFDAEANIRDGQGSVKDYAHYFKLTPDLTQDEAVSRGLLSRAKGKAGWQLARFATDDLYSLWLADKLTDDQASAIVKAAPSDSALQRIGVRQAAKGRNADQLANDINAAKVLTATVPTEQMDMFGSNDAAIKQMERMSDIARAKQRDIQDDIRAISGASKNPERAGKLGVDVKDPAAVQAKLSELWQAKYRWDDWSKDSELIRQIKAEAEPTLELAKPETVEEQKARLAAEEAERQNKLAAEKLAAEANKPLAGTTGDSGQGDLLGGPTDLFAPEAPKKEGGLRSAMTDAERAEVDAIEKEISDKLKNISMGVDPKFFSLGARLAYVYVKAGARQFRAFAKEMLTRLGERARPFLLAWYNNARIQPDSPVAEMDSESQAQKIYDAEFSNNAAQGGRAVPEPTGTSGSRRQPVPRVVRPELIPQPESFVRADTYGAATGFQLDFDQIHGANAALTHFQRNPQGAAFLLADGTGFGKSAQIIAVIDQYRKQHPGAKVLYVTQNKQMIAGSWTRDAKSMGADLLGVDVDTYDSIKKHPGRQYDLVVFDEAQNLKNGEAAKSMAAARIKSKHRMFATATPMDRPTGAAYFLAEITGEDETEVAKKLGYTYQTQQDPITQQIYNYAVLLPGFTWQKVWANIIAYRDAAIGGGAMLRRDYPFYGEVREHGVTWGGLPNKMAADAITKHFDALIERVSSPTAKRNYSGQRTLSSRRWSELTKVPEAFALAKAHLAKGGQVIIMAETDKAQSFPVVVPDSKPGLNDKGRTVYVTDGALTRLHKMFDAAGVKVAHIHDTRNNVVADEVDKFQKGEVKVALATPKSGGAGINLDDTAGDKPRLLIVMSPELAGDVFDQVLGRVSRKTTQSEATVLLMNNSDSWADARSKNIRDTKIKTLRAIQGGEDLDTAGAQLPPQEPSALRETTGGFPTLDGIAQDLYGKPYDELTHDEAGQVRVTVESELAGIQRRQQLGAAARRQRAREGEQLSTSDLPAAEPSGELQSSGPTAASQQLAAVEKLNQRWRNLSARNWPSGQRAAEGQSFHTDSLERVALRDEIGAMWALLRKDAYQTILDALKVREQALIPMAQKVMTEAPRTPDGNLNIKAFKNSEGAQTVLDLENVRSRIAEFTRRVKTVSETVYPGAEAPVLAAMRRLADGGPNAIGEAERTLQLSEGRELPRTGFNGNGGVGTGIEQTGSEGTNEGKKATGNRTPQMVEEDLRRSGKVLWGTSDEISQAHLASHGHVLPPASSEGMGPSRRRESHPGSEAGSEAIPARPRIYIETISENHRLLVVHNANLLAHRILFGTDNLEAGLLEASRFVKQLSDKLPGVPFAFLDHSSRYKAFYSSELDAIVVNTRFLDRNIDVETYDHILSEELIHAVDYHINSKGEREAVWNSLSPEEQSRTREAYNRSGDNPNLTPEQLGSEYLRMVVQDRLLGKVSEETERSPDFTQQVKDALKRFLNFLRETFAQKPANNIARQIVERIEGAIRGDAIPDYPIDWNGESVGSGVEKAADPELEQKGEDVVQIAGKEYTIPDRGNFSPAQNVKSEARVHDLFEKTLKLPGDRDTTVDRRRGSTDANMVYRIQADGFNHDAEGRQLLSEIQAQIESQHHMGGDPSYVSALVNAVNKNFAAGNLHGVFSPELINELVSTTVSESSWRGRMLRAITGLPEDLHSIALNAGLYLRRIYANAFGGSELDSVFKRVMTQFRGFFTEGDYKEIQDTLSGSDAGKRLTSFLDQLEALRRSEAGGRLYRILQGKYKPKRPLTTAALEGKAFTNEEVAKILEEMAAIGLKPTERTGKKKLTPLEELKLMVADSSVGRVERDVEAAIQSGERNAGLAAMIKAEAKETDQAKKQALRDDIDLMQTDAQMVADPKWVEEGLKDPKFAHWKIIRDNWLGYSPTSLDLVRRVIKGDFKGTRFEDPKVRPADTRINLDALAKEPEAEVQRALDAHMANVEAEIVHATPEAREQVVKMIKEQVAEQLEKARARIRDPMFKEPKATGAKLTPEQAIVQKLNAGLFRDPRLDIAGMVERVAGKSQVKRLTPNLTDLIRQVFDTPIYRQSELGQRFSDALIKNLDVDPSQTSKAAQVFEQAFASKFKLAKERALAAAKQSLTPTERNIFAKRSLWQKIERGVNAGLFDSGDLLRQIAEERGWEPPTNETVETLKNLAIREQQLRELNPRELADLERKGATPEQIEEACSTKEAATTYARTALIKRMGTTWAEMTRPLPLSKNPGRMAKLWWEHRRNYAAALNELNTFNLLAKVGFTAYRLPMHLTTQLLGHLPTRAIARAMEIRKIDLAAGNTTQFWKDVGSALHDSAQATLAALRPALVAARAEILGRGESRNVDRLLSGINGLERLFKQAKTYWDNGDYVRATIAHFFAWPRVMAWYISAVDHWQGTPVEYADIIHRVEMSMRGMGRTEAEIKTFKDDVFKQMKTEIAAATIEARQYLDNEGIEATEKQVREAAWKVVRRNIYNSIERAGLPADDFEADNKILADTQSWQVPTTGGAGMIVASPLRWASELASRAGLPMPLARFTNAIATSINYSLMWTPAYKLADFGRGENRSTWFRTDFDRSQRLAQAALGTIMGGVALSLMSAGVLKMTPPWILDKNERDEFERQGHKLNTLEFVLPGGKFIPLSVLVGPFTLIAPYLYFGGSMQRLFEKRTKAQEKLNAEAAKKGVPPGKIRPVSALEMLGAAAETAFGATLGNRSVSGLSSSVTQFGTLNANKTVATAIAPQIPGLPGYQEISRAMGVAMDKNLASVWDYLVPLPTSGARALNMLGDPVGTPDNVQRVIQTMTSGTYPWVVDPKDASKETAYQVLFETGYRPPTINPSKGYLINGEYRPMNDSELEKYTATRGQMLKQALSGMQGATAKQVKAVFQGVNQSALDAVGAQNVKSQTDSGGSSVPHGNTAGIGSVPSTSSRASAADSGAAPRAAAVGAGGTRRTTRLTVPGSRMGGTRSMRLASGSRSGRPRRLVSGRLHVRSGGSLRRMLASRSVKRRHLIA